MGENRKLQVIYFSNQIPHLGYWVNSADPVQMPQYAASDQGQHCFRTGDPTQKSIEIRTSTKNPCN